MVEAEEEGGSDESGGVGGLRTFFIVMAVFISSVFAFYVGFLLWTRIHSARERRRFLHAGHRGPTVRTPYAFGPSEAVAAGSGGDAYVIPLSGAFVKCNRRVLFCLACDGTGDDLTALAS